MGGTPCRATECSSTAALPGVSCAVWVGATSTPYPLVSVYCDIQQAAVQPTKPASKGVNDAPSHLLVCVHAHVEVPRNGGCPPRLNDDSGDRVDQDGGAGHAEAGGERRQLRGNGKTWKKNILSRRFILRTNTANNLGPQGGGVAEAGLEKRERRGHGKWASRRGKRSRL